MSKKRKKERKKRKGETTKNKNIMQNQIDMCHYRNNVIRFNLLFHRNNKMST